jgi:hemoglobin-like flavoprotein
LATHVNDDQREPIIQDTAADLFYDRLFAIAPNLRRLFPVDMREQKRKLIQMIATAVGGLNNLDRLVPAVKALGARHSGYGVTAAHYELVGEALLWTLERGLGECFTPEVRSAWANVYGALAGTMQAAEVDECAPPNLSAGSLHETVPA